MSDPVLSCEGLVKRYGDLVAVAGLDLRVLAGECFGLLGPNGAGKTTTVEIFEGLLQPDAGAVALFGQTWGRQERELRQRIGIQLQETQLSDKLTVLETIRLFRSFYERGHRPEDVMAQVSLEEKADARVGKLSGGQKQRLSLACALVCEPDLLFLDEPTTGLDPQSRRQIWDIIADFRGRGGTVLLTTHYMEEAERLCDRVAIIDRGKIIALDTPRGLIAGLAAEHVVEFEPVDGVRLEAFDDVRGVREVTREGAIVRLTVAAVHSAVPAILDELSRQRVEISRLSTHHATLEDVFLELTGRHLRDDA